MKCVSGDVEMYEGKESVSVNVDEVVEEVEEEEEEEEVEEEEEKEEEESTSSPSIIKFFFFFSSSTALSKTFKKSSVDEGAFLTQREERRE